MLRKIIMSLGVFVALLPYLGFPHAIDNWLYTAAGLLIFFLLVFSKKTKPIHLPVENEGVTVSITSSPISRQHGVLHEERSEEENQEARELPVSHDKGSLMHQVDLETPELSMVGTMASHDAPKEPTMPEHRPKTKRKKKAAGENPPEGVG